MDLKNNFIKLLEEDYGFRCDVKRILDIDEIESKIED